MAAHRGSPAGRRRTGHADGRRRLPAAVSRGRSAMTTTGGGPVLHGADAAVPAGGGGSSVSMRRALRPRTVLGLARAEASMLARSLLVLAGLLGGAVVIWLF